MASIKVKFRPSAVGNGEGTIYYQVIHDRKIRRVFTDYHLPESTWDHRRATVRNTGISEDDILRERLRLDMECARRVMKALDAKGTAYEVDEIVFEFLELRRLSLLSVFMKTLIKRMRRNGKIRTAETYATTHNCFRRFLDTISDGTFYAEDDFMLDYITPELMESFESWLLQKGITPNTTSFYARILRAVYNRGVEQGLIENRNPFRRVYTGVEKTVKRSLPLSTISKIKALDLADAPELDYARDIFILSFCLRGMSFVDMAFLRKTDLNQGIITYRRRKTGQMLVIKWTREMQAILNKYPSYDTPYLLPIIRSTKVNQRNAYRNASYRINRNLKKVALMAGIVTPLTLYVARHSWASAAKAKGIPVSVISEGMGHDSETTTKIYLASLDTAIVDRANELILSSL